MIPHLRHSWSTQNRNWLILDFPLNTATFSVALPRSFLLCLKWLQTTFLNHLSLKLEQYFQLNVEKLSFGKKITQAKISPCMYVCKYICSYTYICTYIYITYKISTATSIWNFIYITMSYYYNLTDPKYYHFNILQIQLWHLYNFLYDSEIQCVPYGYSKTQLTACTLQMRSSHVAISTSLALAGSSNLF